MTETTFPSPFGRKLLAVATFLALCVPLFLIIGRAVADVSMGIVSVCFLLSSMVEKKWDWIKMPWFKLALVTFLSLFISGLTADYDIKVGVFNAIAWLRYPLFTIAFASWILPDEKTRRYLLPSLAILLVLVAIDTAAQFLTGISLTGHVKPDYAGRLTGPFHSKLLVGTFMARLGWSTIGFMFGWYFMKQSKGRLLLVLLFSLVVGAIVLISGERAALAVFCLAGFIFALSARKMRKLLLGTGFVVAAVMVAAIWFNPVLNARFIQVTMPILEDVGDSPYGAVWHNGFVAWKSSPIFGVGLNNFVPMCQKLGHAAGFRNELSTIPGVECVRHAHNPYLEWMAEAGLAGLACFIALIIFWYREILRQLCAAKEDLPLYYSHLGSAVGLVIFLWPFTASLSFFSNWSATLFWWVLALALHPGKKLPSAAAETELKIESATA